MNEQNNSQVVQPVNVTPVQPVQVQPTVAPQVSQVAPVAVQQVVAPVQVQTVPVASQPTPVQPAPQPFIPADFKPRQEESKLHFGLIIGIVCLIIIGSVGYLYYLDSKRVEPEIDEMREICKNAYKCTKNDKGSKTCFYKNEDKVIQVTCQLDEGTDK